MKKYLIDAVKVDGAYASTYNIRVIFKNEKGEKVEVIERGTLKLPDGIHVQDVIDLSVMPILKKLGWKRKFLWCKHERITASTQLCDIAYQAKSGELVLDCTNVDKIPEKPEPEVSEVVFMITLVTLTNKGFCRNASYVSKIMMENNISIAW